MKCCQYDVKLSQLVSMNASSLGNTWLLAFSQVLNQQVSLEMTRER